MAITTAMIKELREATGAGILDSKKALEAADGNFEKAVESLRQKGLASAAKKSSREANDGLIAAKMSDDGRKAVITEVNCETDFVARTDDFINFVDNITQQVFDSDELHSVDNLLSSNYAANPTQSVADAVQETISKLGENIIIRGLDRFNLGASGVLDVYIHSNRRVGVLVELNTENDVVEQGKLKALAHDLALQVAAANPSYLAVDDIPSDVLEKEREILMSQLADDPKPDNIKQRIVDGRLKKFYQEHCLLEQEFVKDGSLSVTKLIQQTGKELDVPISVRRFTRFEIGAN